MPLKTLTNVDKEAVSNFQNPPQSKTNSELQPIDESWLEDDREENPLFMFDHISGKTTSQQV